MKKFISLLFFLFFCGILYFLLFLIQTKKYDDLAIEIQKYTEKHFKETKKVSKDAMENLKILVEDELIETKNKKHIDSH
jgi:TRAP-type C4-dicarboxylate transport system substrate-binding protein